MVGIKMDEEIFLADTEDSSDIFFPDDKIDSSVNLQDKNIVENNEIDEIYSLLKISEKPEKVDFKEYFKSNPKIFKIAGVDYYKTLTPDQYLQFEKKCEQLISQAKGKWNTPKLNYKIAELDDALGTLKSIFRTEAATNAYTLEIKRTLNDQIKNFLKQKIKDGILEISEIQELYEIAVSIHLVTDSETGKKAILEWIKKSQEKQQFKIESYTETFIRNVSEKSPFECFDTDVCKKQLLEEFCTLEELSEKLTNNIQHKTASELYQEMYKVLIDNNLFVDNVKLYTEDFFDKEQKAGKYNFSLALNDEYYYYLKGTAIHNYQFTDIQWNDFVRIQHLRKTDDASAAFIMGTEKASSIMEIADLLEENPNMAVSRIRAGDLKTYFEHIGSLQLSNQLSVIKEEFKNDTDLLVKNVVALLRGSVGLPENETKEDVKSTDSLLPLIEKKVAVKELVSYLLRRKQFEALNRKILSNTNEHSSLDSYLRSQGFSFIKLCMNYLHEFPEESNALAYKNMYETYANYVLSRLVENKDCFVFVCVFMPILGQIEKEMFLSNDFLSKYNDIEEQMMIKFNEEKLLANTVSEKKQKKSLFRHK